MVRNFTVPYKIDQQHCDRKLQVETSKTRSNSSQKKATNADPVVEAMEVQAAVEDATHVLTDFMRCSEFSLFQGHGSSTDVFYTQNTFALGKACNDTRNNVDVHTASD